MKLFFISVSLILAISLPSQAQQNKARIFYSRNVPALVRQQIPSGGETKFFGVWKPENKKRDILVHFYSAPAKEEPLLCKVDIFERLVTNSKLKRINSIRLDGTPELSRHAELFKYITNNVPNTVVTLTYGADVVWANQKEKQTPLLRLHVLSSGGLHGQYGEYILIIFPKGWHEKANVQYFSWGSNTIDADVVSFDKVDEDGFMVVTVTHTENNAMPDNATVFDFYWNGKFFSEKPIKSDPT